jgi:hypothetical protein
MTTKREAKFVEEIVSSMTEREYWQFVGWLANGATEPLWDCLRPYRRTATGNR